MEERIVVWSRKRGLAERITKRKESGERLILEKNSRWGFADYGEGVPYPFIAKLFDVSVYRVKKCL